MSAEFIKNPFYLSGRTILVTGASSGIGCQVAIWLSIQGAKIILVARNIERLESTLSLLQGDGHSIEVFDFLSDADVSAWLKNVVKKTGPLSGLVHAAGIQLTLPIRATTMSQWERIMETNVTSAFSLIKAFRQKGVYEKGSSIVLLSSVMAKAGQPGLIGYCTSKGAIESMVRAAASELACEGIRVNSIAPGHVRSEMADVLKSIIGSDSMLNIEKKHPLGFGEPLDVAYAVNYLISPAARWVTGTSLIVDGGYLVE